MSRAAIHQAISTDADLIDLGFVKTYGALGAENPEEDRFIVLRYGDEDLAFGEHGTQFLTVWAYDRDASYARIDMALSRVTAILRDMVQVTGTDGRTVVQVNANGRSADLYDDIMRRTTRNAVFTVNAR